MQKQNDISTFGQWQEIKTIESHLKGSSEFIVYGKPSVGLPDATNNGVIRIAKITKQDFDTFNGNSITLQYFNNDDGNLTITHWMFLPSFPQ